MISIFRNKFGLLDLITLNLITGNNVSSSSSAGLLQRKLRTRNLIVDQNPLFTPSSITAAAQTIPTCDSGEIIVYEDFKDYDNSWSDNKGEGGRIQVIPGYGTILGGFDQYYKTAFKTFRFPGGAESIIISFTLFEFGIWDDIKYEEKGLGGATVIINGVTISLGKFLENNQLQEDDYSSITGNEIMLERKSQGTPEMVGADRAHKDQIHKVTITLPKSVYEDTGGAINYINFKIKFRFGKKNGQSAGIDEFKITACKSSISNDIQEASSGTTSQPTSDPTSTPTLKLAPKMTLNPTLEATSKPTFHNMTTSWYNIAPKPAPTVEGSKPISSPTPTVEGPKPTSNPTPTVEGSNLTLYTRPTVEGSKPTSNPTPTVEGSKPNLKPTLAVDASKPTSTPIFYSPDSNVGQKCQEDFQCTSGYCSPEKKTCYASPECKAIKQVEGSTFHENRIILILVGSGFNDLAEWQDQAKETYSTFSEFPFFDDTNDLFHVFYVEKLEPSFCDFNCSGIRRLLCCDKAKIRSLARSCFPTGSKVQTLAIHNDNQYGGAGYRVSNIATVSRHPRSGLIAVHELGHSLFELGDEYSHNANDSSPNCDNTGCSKWADLEPLMGPNFCNPGGCRGGNYYTGDERSFMKGLNKRVDHVNLRFTCCTYLALTNDIPSYCDQYKNIGDGLVSYCQRDYQNYGYPFVDVNNNYKIDSRSSSSQAAPPLIGANHNDEGKYMKLKSPVTLSIDIGRLVQNQRSVGNNTLSQQQAYSLHTEQNMPGLYEKSEIIGSDDYFASAETSTSSGDEVLHVQAVYQSGKVKDMMFSGMEHVHVPFPDPYSSLSDDTTDDMSVVKQSVSTLDIFFDNEGEQIDGNIVEVDVQVISL